MTRRDRLHDWQFICRTLYGAAVVAALFSITPIAAQTTEQRVFSANYDLIFTINGREFQVRSLARVRSGSAIPIDLGRYRIDIGINDQPSGRPHIQLRIFERSADNWYQIETDELGFEADLVSPAEFKWQSADIGIDLALIVSRAPSRARQTDTDF